MLQPQAGYLVSGADGPSGSAEATHIDITAPGQVAGQGNAGDWREAWGRGQRVLQPQAGYLVSGADGPSGSAEATHIDITAPGQVAGQGMLGIGARHGDAASGCYNHKPGYLVSGADGPSGSAEATHIDITAPGQVAGQGMLGIGARHGDAASGCYNHKPGT